MREALALNMGGTVPYLSIEDRKSMLGPTGETCRFCGEPKEKRYCRQDDEFFEHCRCANKHQGHRFYAHDTITAEDAAMAKEKKSTGSTDPAPEAGDPVETVDPQHGDDKAE
jgi:hypothetical protein